MGADLVGAHYPLNGVLDSLLGQARNAAQSNAPIRSNLEYLGIGGGLTDTAGATIAPSGIMIVVPIPVDVGTEVSKISVLIGATAASVPTHSFAALYQGSGASPALIGQSTDGATAAVATGARFDFTLTTPYVIGSNVNDAPNGYVFAAYQFVATTQPSIITNAGTIAAAAQYAWWPNSPGHGGWSLPGSLSFSAGSGLTTAAPATLIIVAQKTVAPVVFLS
jgi:hypothetical protein